VKSQSSFYRPLSPTIWSADSQSLFVRRRNELPAKIFRVDVTSGRRELWREISLSDPAGVYAVDPILITPDEKSYVYTYQRTLSEFYVVDGLK
jgi:hypothetical protein